MLPSMILPQILGCVGLFASAAALPSSLDSIPLNRYAMVMAHDAASGYLDTSRPIKNEVYDWTKTQSFPLTGTARDVLTCGGRAFDWRPLLTSSGDLIGHHGDVPIPHEFGESLEEIKGFLGDNPGEMAVMTVWDCVTEEGAGSTCGEEVRRVLGEKGIRAVEDCDDLMNKTVGEARAMGSLGEGKGSLLVTTGGGSNGGCSNANYDETLACWGTSRRAEEVGVEGEGEAPEEDLISLAYCCWEGKDNGYPLSQMDAYCDRVAAETSWSTPFNQMQAMWQESTASVVIGELHLSSLLEDEERSGLNRRLAGRVRGGTYGNLNLVEVNYVCDGGEELKGALDDFNKETAERIEREGEEEGTMLQ